MKINQSKVIGIVIFCLRAIAIVLPLCLNKIIRLIVSNGSFGSGVLLCVAGDTLICLGMISTALCICLSCIDVYVYDKRRRHKNQLKKIRVFIYVFVFIVPFFFLNNIKIATKQEVKIYNYVGQLSSNHALEYAKRIKISFHGTSVKDLIGTDTIKYYFEFIDGESYEFDIVLNDSKQLVGLIALDDLLYGSLTNKEVDWGNCSYLSDDERFIELVT
jgi:hypothetical protein